MVGGRDGAADYDAQHFCRKRWRRRVGRWDVVGHACDSISTGAVGRWE